MKPTTRPAPSAPRRAPTAHHASPSLSADPQPHAHAPTAAFLEGPAPHFNSPTLSVDPSPHAGTPTAQILELPTPHRASPALVPDIRPHAGSPNSGADPEPHASAPSGRILDGPTAHASSPSLEDAEPTRQVSNRAPTAGDAGLGGVLRGLWTIARSATGRAGPTASTDAWGRDASLAAALRPLGELLYDRYWRVQVEGAQNVPQGPCILVANHAGALPIDGPLVHLALKRERPDLNETRWLLEDQVFHAPVVGTIANRLGAVRASPENALRLLDEGRPLLVFPEGFLGVSKPFSERYQLRRFGRGGYLKIALRAGAPIVPLAIVGSEESTPLLGKLPLGFLGIEFLPVTLPPLPSRWQLQFGEPISLDGAPHEPEADPVWIDRKNLEVRTRLQTMLDALVAKRGGVF